MSPYLEAQRRIDRGERSGTIDTACSISPLTAPRGTIPELRRYLADLREIKSLTGKIALADAEIQELTND